MDSPKKPGDSHVTVEKAPSEKAEFFKDRDIAYDDGLINDLKEEPMYCRNI